MKTSTCLIVIALIAASLVAASGEQQQEQQQQKRILRRVIKSTSTATNLGRVRLVTVRAADSLAEKGAVSEISSKEAASFGQRSSNETNTQQQSTTKTKLASNSTAQEAPQKSPLPAPVPTADKSKTASAPITTSTTPTTTTTTSTTPTPAAATSTSTTTAASTGPKASERLQAAPELELLSSAPSSWQMMTAVEAPAAALIAAGTRPVAQPIASSDLVASSSSEFAHNDFERASRSQLYSSSRQQGSKTRQQQSSFYPPQQLRQGKTSSYHATKTQWYQPTSTTTTPRPAPIIQEQQYEHYVEQVDSAPPGQAEPFAFDFNTQDTSGNGQYRKEESDNNGVVRGSYGFRDASGLYRHVEYVADHNGFRATIKSNEPGLDGGRDSQPASIKLDSGPAPTLSQRFTNNDNNDWSATPSSGIERADLSLAPPNFESSHKPERIRVNFRS